MMSQEDNVKDECGAIESTSSWLHSMLCQKLGIGGCFVPCRRQNMNGES